MQNFLVESTKDVDIFCFFFFFRILYNIIKIQFSLVPKDEQFYTNWELYKSTVTNIYVDSSHKWQYFLFLLIFLYWPDNWVLCYTSECFVRHKIKQLSLELQNLLSHKKNRTNISISFVNFITALKFCSSLLLSMSFYTKWELFKSMATYMHVDNNKKCQYFFFFMLSASI